MCTLKQTLSACLDLQCWCKVFSDCQLVFVGVIVIVSALSDSLTAAVRREVVGHVRNSAVLLG